jgi:hypothetical protein
MKSQVQTSFLNVAGCWTQLLVLTPGLGPSFLVFFSQLSPKCTSYYMVLFGDTRLFIRAMRTAQKQTPGIRPGPLVPGRKKEVAAHYPSDM